VADPSSGGGGGGGGRGSGFEAALGELNIDLGFRLKGLESVMRGLKKFADDTGSAIRGANAAAASSAMDVEKRARTFRLSQRPLTFQESGIRRASEQVKEFTAQIERLRASGMQGSGGLNQVSQAFTQLQGTMKQGVLGTVDAQRAIDRFNVTLNEQKRRLQDLKAAGQAGFPQFRQDAGLEQARRQLLDISDLARRLGQPTSARQGMVKELAVAYGQVAAQAKKGAGDQAAFQAALDRFANTARKAKSDLADIRGELVPARQFQTVTGFQRQIETLQAQSQRTIPRDLPASAAAAPAASNVRASLQAAADATRNLEAMQKAGTVTAMQFAQAQEAVRNSLNQARIGLADVRSKLSGVGHDTDDFTQAMRRLAETVVLATGPLSGVGSRILTFAALVNRTGPAIATLVASLAGLGVAFYASSKQAVQSAVQMQTIWGMMRAGVDTNEQATQSFTMVRDTALKMGVSFIEAAQGYAKLATAARGTSLEGAKTQRLFEGLVDAGVAMRLSDIQLEGSFRAVQQMMSKSVVQSEELVGQLGEQLPGAIRLAASSMGMTTQAFLRATKAGQIMAVDLLPKLADSLVDTFGGEAEKASHQLLADMTRLSTASSIFFESFGRTTGITTAFQKAVEGLGATLAFAATHMNDVIGAAGGLVAVLAILAGGRTITALMAVFNSFKSILSIFNPLTAGIATFATGGTTGILRLVGALAAGAASFFLLSRATRDASAAQDELTGRVDDYIKLSNAQRANHPEIGQSLNQQVAAQIQAYDTLIKSAEKRRDDMRKQAASFATEHPFLSAMAPGALLGRESGMTGMNSDLQKQIASEEEAIAKMKQLQSDAARLKLTAPIPALALATTTKDFDNFLNKVRDLNREYQKNQSIVNSGKQLTMPDIVDDEAVKKADELLAMIAPGGDYVQGLIAIRKEIDPTASNMREWLIDFVKNAGTAEQAAKTLKDAVTETARAASAAMTKTSADMLKASADLADMQRTNQARAASLNIPGSRYAQEREEELRIEREFADKLQAIHDRAEAARKGGLAAGTGNMGGFGAGGDIVAAARVRDEQMRALDLQRAAARQETERQGASQAAAAQEEAAMRRATSEAQKRVIAMRTINRESEELRVSLRSQISDEKVINDIVEKTRSAKIEQMNADIADQERQRSKVLGDVKHQIEQQQQLVAAMQTRSPSAVKAVEDQQQVADAVQQLKDSLLGAKASQADINKLTAQYRDLLNESARIRKEMADQDLIKDANKDIDQLKRMNAALQQGPKAVSDLNKQLSREDSLKKFIDRLKEVTTVGNPANQNSAPLALPPVQESKIQQQVQQTQQAFQQALKPPSLPQEYVEALNAAVNASSKLGDTSTTDAAAKSTADLAGSSQELLDSFGKLTPEMQALVVQYAKLTDANELQQKQFDQTKALNDAMAQSFTRSFDTIGDAITTAFVSGQRDAVDWGGTLKGVLASLMQDFLRFSAINPLENVLFGQNLPVATGGILGRGLMGLFGMGGAAAGGTPGATNLPAAPTSYASGGVTSGILRGPGFRIGEQRKKEGVFPLVRTSGGDLGVRAIIGPSYAPRGGDTVFQVIDMRGKGAPVETRTSMQGGKKVTQAFIRDGVGSAVRDGSLDQSLANEYGIRRRLRTR
jgi:tape measure domain-containing protein